MANSTPIVPRVFGGTLLLSPPAGLAATTSLTALGRDGRQTAIARDGKQAAIARDGQLNAQGR